MIAFKKQLFDLEVKGQGPKKVITVRDTALWSCTHIPNIIYLSGKKKIYGPDKLRWEEAEEADTEVEAEEKIRLKQYVSLRSKGRHNYTKKHRKKVKIKQSVIPNLKSLLTSGFLSLLILSPNSL